MKKLLVHSLPFYVSFWAFGYVYFATWNVIADTRPPLTLTADLESRIESLVTEAIENKQLPGCVICAGTSRSVDFARAYGNRDLQPTTVPMSTDTVFDMASITKPVATATSIMKLIEQGQLRLGNKVVDFFPQFASHGKEAIIIRDLLIHQSGLIPDNALADYEQGPDVAWQKICELELVAPVGSTFKYSDVNFIVLGKIVEHISGQDLNVFSQQQIFKPLGMLETGFLPNKELRLRAAPTEQRGGQWIRGEVHDPRAFALGGVAGHAGLFSTAADLSIYARMMLNQGAGQAENDTPPQSILSPNTVRLMTAENTVSSGIRGLGWDKQTGYSSNKGDLLSGRAFGHGGFTGTVLWMDPDLDLFFIFLSNRVHPDGTGSVNTLAGRILNVVASARSQQLQELTSKSHTNNSSQVLTGIDVLKRDAFRQLEGLKVGLITNHTGRTLEGHSTIETFLRAPQVELVALFSPEHGLEGKLDISKISDSQDAGSGLRIFSLYGETRRPTSDMLSHMDALVFDIQDIGTRFYTYISTMGEAMQAAADNQKKFIVLDRPNPLGGLTISGPMLDKGKESFVAFHNIPVQHGMTVGELARLFQAELNLNLNLEVIPCEAWNREQLWDQTGLTWVNPSPNMRCLTQAILYPGIGLLETTNVSVGRGTDTPFEIIGAPWLKARELATTLNALDLPGVRFVPVEFIPSSSKFENQLCHGINIIITNRAAYQSVPVGLQLAYQLHRLHPDDWEIKNYIRLMGCDELLTQLQAGASPEKLVEIATQHVGNFRARRQPHLLY
ncbi:MAG: DUF1343 domain-containing protein [Planctomycetales bacterium]|nr:DUF1343 domain-containing protein [Planctomycetales bacterium]